MLVGSFGKTPALPASTPAKEPEKTTFLLGFCEGGEEDLLVDLKWICLAIAAGKKETEEQARGRISKPSYLRELISRARSA